MTISFVLGNGRSRLAINSAQLRHHGKIYACNAIYREFTPDVLVATDRPIAQAIERSGYPLKHKFYTRNPDVKLGSMPVLQSYRGYSSGPNAIGLACYDGATKIYMLGFDCGSPTSRLNNVYADTEFYRSSLDKATFAGNWVKQITRICHDYPEIIFIRVTGTESTFIPEFSNIPNLTEQQIGDFQIMLNSLQSNKI